MLMQQMQICAGEVDFTGPVTINNNVNLVNLNLCLRDEYWVVGSDISAWICSGRVACWDIKPGGGLQMYLEHERALLSSQSLICKAKHGPYEIESSSTCSETSEISSFLAWRTFSAALLFPFANAFKRNPPKKTVVQVQASSLAVNWRSGRILTLECNECSVP